MKSKLIFSCIILLLHGCHGVIYNLNETEYERMPPIYRLDDYKSCLQKPKDVYCMMNFQLVSDEPSELLRMIEEYSEYYRAHFNHSKLRYGMCVTQSCQSHIQDNTTVSETSLERCLNESFWENYRLKTKLKDYSCYSSSDDKLQINNSDITAGIIVLTIVMLSVIGTFYDIYCAKTCDDTHILLSFSLIRNWKALTSTKPSTEPRLENFKGLNGFKFIGQFLIINVHCVIPYFMIGENTHEAELFVNKLEFKFFIHLPILMQLYFIISACLLTYHLELYLEKNPINCSILFKGILIRCIRLTPSYAVIVLLSATWFKFLGYGPLWELTRKGEVMECQERWWMNLLYLNNYVYNPQCIPPSWYLAADTQLFCLNLVVYLLLRDSKSKKSILLCLIAIGSIINGLHTYVRDLEIGPSVTPSHISEVFANDPSFNETYRMGHANTSSSLIGMGLAYLIYWCQKNRIDFRQYSWLKYAYWSTLPILIGTVISGSIFYGEGPRKPLYIIALYSTFIKPLVSILMAILIAGTVFKVENFYRRVCEWDGWIVPSRLLYGSFLLHFLYVMVYINIQTNLITLTVYNLILLSVCVTLASTVTAVPLYLFVEAPSKEVLKYYMLSKPDAIINDKTK